MVLQELQALMDLLAKYVHIREEILELVSVKQSKCDIDSSTYMSGPSIKGHVSTNYIPLQNRSCLRIGLEYRLYSYYF